MKCKIHKNRGGHWLLIVCADHSCGDVIAVIPCRSWKHATWRFGLLRDCVSPSNLPDLIGLMINNGANA